MSSKSKRLGNLVDVFHAEKLEGTIRKIKTNLILPSPKQPRQNVDNHITELSQSIEQYGLLQPIVVTKKEDEEKYLIVAGERRFRSILKLGWQEIECKILNKNEKETFLLAIVENLQRENLSPYEELDALIHLKNLYNYTDEEVAKICGKSRNYISEILGIATMGKENLTLCNEYGIQTKNLLVQASLAFKKGILPNFLQKFKNGELTTVKEAKNFNQFNLVKIQKSKNLEKKISIQNLDYKISKKENAIIISSLDQELLIKIYNFLKKELNKKLE